MEVLIGLHLFTHCLIAASLLVLLLSHAPEGPWPRTARAARHFGVAYADGLSVHPRDYYLGTYGARCRHHLTGVVTSNDAAERLACFSGHGVRVALLDTGLCAGITEHSRNSVTCTSVVPGVACEDAGCAHGTRSVSVLAGQLAVSPLAKEPPKEAARRNSERGLASAGQYLGLAPGATVRMFRVFDRRKRTRQRYLARALDVLLREAEDGEAGRTHRVWNTSSSRIRRHDETVDVISLSYGSEDYYGNPQVQERLYRLMHEYGVIIVAAAGNAGVRFGSVRSPADMPGVLAVGALRIEGRGASARTAQMSRTFGAYAPYHPATPNLALNLSSSASVLGDFADSFAATSGNKSVAHFSGRGPTTWELPFGAGRVKPDLIALGQRVWTVRGLSAASFSAAAPRTRRASPALRLDTASGTSIAAPIVAGVVALCLEAAWSSPFAATSAQNITKDGALRDVRHNRLIRVSDSLRVREAVLRTAIPLLDTAVSPPLSPQPTPATLAHSNASATESDKHPRRVLAGVPLLQLYARYLYLSRVSILSQGAGEVQPLRALYAIVAGTPASSGFVALDALRSCASFAVPPSVRIGWGNPRGGSSSIGVGIPQRYRPPHDPDAEAHIDSPLPRLPDVPLATQSAAYWWPFSEQLIYPGATPVLLNLSLHLCPTSYSAAPGHDVHRTATATNGEAARLQSTAPYTRVTYVLTKATGYVRAREAYPARHSSCHDGACPLPLFLSYVSDDRRERSISSKRPLSLSACNASSRASSTEGEAEEKEALIMGPRHTRQAPRPSAKRPFTQQRWMHRLLHVATELTVMASRSPTRPDAGEQLSLPPTSFSLSVAVSSPLSADTRLCYDVARETVAMWRERGKRSQSTENGVEVPEDHGSCVPLFHLFRVLDVEGALHIFNVDSSSQPTLTVPLAVRVVQPPPRAQRVLIDTSLDWFNPTAATSDLFIAGDDPHESAAGGAGTATRRGQWRQPYERAYAEVSGGDHPYTNLSLLWLYLRHTLGMAVETFPLLHTSAMATSIAAGCSASLSPSAKPTSNVSRAALMAPANTLAQVGTLIIVDPELPLKRDMRRLLTRAVLSGDANDSGDGLNVLLVTDWYSADVAAQLHWTRGESLDEVERSFRSSGTDAAEAAVDVDGDKSAVLHLRAQRRLANSSTRGLGGSSHVPSWNRWLSEVTVASGNMGNGSDCSNATDRSSEWVLNVMPELPFELSEKIVIDGVVVVNAAALAEESRPDSSTTATHGGGGTITLAKATALRSLGHLNAAGVLQWRLPAHQQAARVAAAGALKEAQETNARGTNCTSSASTVPSTLAGEAVMCNVVPSWAQQQRRLVKRTVVGTSDGSPSASAKSNYAAGAVEEAVVEDDWEDVPAEEREGLLVRIGGLEAVEMHARASGEANASTAAQWLTHGVVGFLTFPPPPPTRVAAAPTHRFRPGRIAIFTDSDCLSTSDYHVQGALDELEGLLYPPSASSSLPLAACGTLDCFARSPDGQRLLQAESIQSSLCVEVVKELLLWTQTGNWHRWRDSAQLHCEARRWAPAAHRRVADTTPNTDTARPVSADSEEEASFDDLLGTAPERAHVGEVVWRLWVALAENTARDTASLVDGAEGKTRLRRGDKAEQENAAAGTVRALNVSYHGEWRAHLKDSNVSSSSTGAADESYSPPPRTAEGRRGGHATTRQSAQHPSSINRLLPLDGMFLTLLWIPHPIVLGQLMITAVVFLGVWLWRVWPSLWKQRPQRT